MTAASGQPLSGAGSRIARATFRRAFALLDSRTFVTFLIAASPPAEPSLWMTLPFLALLALIAIGPLAFHRLWEKFYPLAAVGLGSVTIGYYLIVLGEPTSVWHAAVEYFSFIAFIGSLFIIAGGIHIRIKGEATPAVNCLFLLAGAVVSNFIGTTGASMLLIRPWIQMNKYRVTAHHIVFFIFIVGNAGGCLTPIGDPPLFLGYLRGVPFWWVLTRCWEAWLIIVGILLAVFYVVDVRNFRRAPAEVRAGQTEHEEWHFSGTAQPLVPGTGPRGRLPTLWLARGAARGRHAGFVVDHA